MRTRYLFLLALVAFLGVSCADQAEGEGYLTEYLAKFYPGAKVIATECLQKDTDGDGYISCTVRLKEPVTDDEDKPVVPVKYGEPKTVTVECTGTWFYQFKWFQTGCRTPKLHGG